MPGFPHEAVPDGDVLAPHHAYIGLLALLVVCWMVSDDRMGRESWVATVGALTALMGFLFTWRHYPAVGATVTLAGLLAALTTVVARPFWWEYQLVGLRGTALLALAVAFDDVVQHAFGYATPLDTFWARWLHPAVQVIEAGV